VGCPFPSLLLSELADKHNHYAANNKLAEGGWFYVTVSDLEEETTLSRHRQSTALEKLEALGLIELEVRITNEGKVRFFRFPAEIDERMKEILNIYRKLKNRLALSNEELTLEYFNITNLKLKY
jgi:predicted transcriptional regulator